jgi:calcium permeable stress-gated cation channel
MLALLIEERDEILENLEIAEARYISSFRITTPEPSVTDFRPPVPPPKDPSRPYISRPLPLVRTRVRFLTSRPRIDRPSTASYRGLAGDVL